MKKEWFASWFDSAYYHKLYNHRDEAEAKAFIQKLSEHLGFQKDQRALDLACGKGRHSKNLHDHQLDVTGLDLSLESITHARETYSDIEFYTHDMRLPFRINYYDYIFNFFTSFGYFKTELEHVNTLKSMRKGLKADGTLLIDFLNAAKSIQGIVAAETVEKEGITFDLKRRYENQQLFKEISFEAEGNTFYFEERVYAFQLADFERMTKKAGLQIKNTFGDYNLNAFDAATSPRLILELKKA